MIVGQRIRRPDAPDKVKGSALYIEDLAFTGSLWGGVLRSPHPHARIVQIDASKARIVPGVRAVLTAKEIPGRNLIPMVQADWPVLAGEFVRHVGEAVALVAAETKEALAEGMKAIAVEYEPLVALLDMEEALRVGEVMAHWKVRRGEASVALSGRDVVVVEATYRTPYQEHAYIEANGMIAMPDGQGGVTVWGSLQCPFYVQKAVASALGFDLNQVRIVQTVTGGGFGGKEDAPSAPGAHVALLAMASGRPVRLILSREEDMAVMSKRHPSRVRVRLGATRAGDLLAGLAGPGGLQHGAQAVAVVAQVAQGLAHMRQGFTSPKWLMVTEDFTAAQGMICCRPPFRSRYSGTRAR